MYFAARIFGTKTRKVISTFWRTSVIHFSLFCQLMISIYFSQNTQIAKRKSLLSYKFSSHNVGFDWT